MTLVVYLYLYSQCTIHNPILMSILLWRPKTVNITIRLLQSTLIYTAPRIYGGQSESTTPITRYIDLDLTNPAMMEQKNYPLIGETFRPSIMGEPSDQTLYDGHLATIHWIWMKICSSSVSDSIWLSLINVKFMLNVFDPKGARIE